MGNQVELLVDNSDACFVRLGYIAEGHHFSLVTDRPLVSLVNPAKDLHER